MKESLPFADEDDYTMIDSDFAEFLRRGREELEWDARYENRQYVRHKQRER